MFVGPTLGTFVRIDHWVFSSYITDTPVWVIVIDADPSTPPDADYPFEFEIVSGKLLSGDEDEWGPGHTQWVNAHDDRWTIIPDEDVPDEVWAALAKLKLLGESHELDD